MQKHMIMLVGLAVALAACATSARAEDDIRDLIRDEIAAYEKEKGEKKDDGTLKAAWDNGLQFKGKNFKTKLGGRIMFDSVFLDDDDYTTTFGLADDEHSGVEFRRVRLHNDGQIGKHVGYKLQLDFAGGDADFKDVWIELRHLRDCFGCGIPNVRAGQFKEPMGLEQLTSSKYITFMERSAPTTLFTPARSSGIMLHDVFRGGQLGYGVGAFTANEDDFGDGHFSDGVAYTGRVWWTPWYDCACPSRRLHVGAGASYRDDLPGLRFRERPEIHLWSRRPIDTNFTPLLGDADNVFLYNAEVALVLGSFSVQGEYFGAEVDSVAGDDPSFWGWYAQASYFLTGEFRPYKEGAFQRVKPCTNFLDKECCGKGAWEVAVRYSFSDLDDGPVQGGEMGIFTFGVNWYLNPNTRVMFNYVLANVEVGALDEDLSAFMVRFQVDF